VSPNNTTNHAASILIATGGTSGHIYPALAIAEALRSRRPELRIVFCGMRGGQEEGIAATHDFPFSPLLAQNMPSKNDPRYFSWFVNNVRGILQSRRILKKEQPKLVIGTGGYVSAPLMWVARQKRVPYILHEQNSIPGRANLMFAKEADTVFISYDVSRRHFSDKDNLVLSGNPVRPVFFTLDRREARAALGVPDTTFLVLMTGGSQGARTLNRAVAGLRDLDAWHRLIERHPNLLLVHSVGINQDECLAEALSTIPNVSAKSYINNTAYWCAACDFFMGRAGAMTCAEVAASGKPSMLIPYPYAADDHQTSNARALEEAGAAFVVLDDAFTSATLVETVERMIEDAPLRHAMGERARAQSTPNAAPMIAEHVLAMIDGAPR
jgi:UDP-N-acetylglucosamine--N-acetylmuramyl-(pentapeptide) pyrophosphoryl-undecaprenol N-acetylglucosamine transferase